MSRQIRRFRGRPYDPHRRNLARRRSWLERELNEPLDTREILVIAVVSSAYGLLALLAVLLGR